MNNWNACKNIVCIRADNMGDVIMSGPAFRALKETLGCRITLFTSAMGAVIAPSLPYVDDVMVYNVPWVKANKADDCYQLAEDLRTRNFDAAIIFTAYSQSALPAATIAYMAGIPLRLAYCRENPYELLTDWVPDKEPYETIRHQVQRDLDLVATIGAQTAESQLSLHLNELALQTAFNKLAAKGIDVHESWIVVHTGVSEQKREYPVAQWIETVKLLQQQFELPILLTGSASEEKQARTIQQAAGGNVHVVAGLLSIEEFIAIIHEAQLVISVNTATIHIAAATDTPLIVLYALTNPQHTPWNAYARVLPFSVPTSLQSRNQVVTYVSDKLFGQEVPPPTPHEIMRVAHDMLENEDELKETVSTPLFYEAGYIIR